MPKWRTAPRQGGPHTPQPKRRETSITPYCHGAGTCPPGTLPWTLLRHRIRPRPAIRRSLRRTGARVVDFPPMAETVGPVRDGGEGTPGSGPRAQGGVTRLKRKVRRAAKRNPLLRRMLHRYDSARKPASPAPARKGANKATTTPAKGPAKKAAKPAKAPAKPVDFGDLVAVLAGARWLGPTRYELTGWVYGSKVAATLHPPKLRIWFAGGEKPVTAQVEQRTDLRANLTAADGKRDRSGAGFRAVVDLSGLLTGPVTELTARCSLTQQQSRIEGTFTKRISLGSAGSLAPSEVTDTSDGP